MVAVVRCGSWVIGRYTVGGSTRLDAELYRTDSLDGDVFGRSSRELHELKCAK